MRNDMNRWVKVEKGIRYREHKTRKYGIRFDRYFVLRYTVDGKTKQEALGWASEGVTVEKARLMLAQLKEAKRTGEGERTMQEKRDKAAAQRVEAEEAMKEKSRSEITVGQYWEERYYPAQSYKAKGSLVAEDALWRKWLSPVMQNIPLRNISELELIKLRQNMQDAGKAPASIKYAMALVSQLWNMAVRDKIVEGSSPSHMIPLPKRDNKRQRFLNKEESEKLLAELIKKSPQTHDIAILALDCGLRFGEIASLCWEDVNFQQKSILIRDPKARSNRFAFMTNRVYEILKKIKNSKERVGLLFLDTNGKKLARISNSFRLIANVLFNENIDDPRQRVCFHTLRHTFASRLVEGGVSLYEVKELMGHSDFTMTQRYSHLSPEGLRNAIKILE